MCVCVCMIMWYICVYEGETFSESWVISLVLSTFLCFYFIFEDFRHYILIIFSSLLGLSQPPNSGNFMFFLSLGNKRKQKTPPKKTQNTYTVLCWTATSEHWACHGIWIYQCHFIEENWFSLSQKLSVASSILSRSRTLYPLPLLHSGSLSGLSLCRSCISCQTISEFICLCALSNIENAIFLNYLLSLALIIFPLLFSIDSRALRGEVMISTSHLELNNSKVSLSVHVVQLWVSVNHHQLEE